MLSVYAGGLLGLKPLDVAFGLPEFNLYHKAQAGVRIRCFDVAAQLKKEGFRAGLLYPVTRTKIAIFHKCLNDPSKYMLAKKLKKSGVKIVYDINMNAFSDLNYERPYFNKENADSAKRWIDLADDIIVSTEHLLNVYKKYSDKVFLIEDTVHDNFFKYNKRHSNKKPLNIIYCGYSVKTDQLMIIERVLGRLQEKFNIVYTLICEADPMITSFSYRFVKYDHRKIQKQLLHGDIAIAPRDLSDPYNLGHSPIKVAYPLSLGIPVVASPVPSYKELSGVSLCSEQDDWYESLSKLAADPNLRSHMGFEGRKYVQKRFSMQQIFPKYLKALRLND